MCVPLRIEQYEDIPEERTTPRRRKRTSRGLRRLAGVGAICGILSVLGLAGVGAASIVSSLTSAQDLKPAAGGATGGLSAVVGTAHRSSGFVTVTGSVTNSLGRHATNVEAVVELLDSDNRTVQLDGSMLAFANVASGESAPFSVVVPDDSTAVTYRLSFRHPDGRSID